MRTVEINGTKYPVKIGHRALIEYERRSGNLNGKISSLEDSTLLLFLAIEHGAKRAGLPFDMDFEQFIDYCDDHPEIVEVPDAGEEEKKT